MTVDLSSYNVANAETSSATKQDNLITQIQTSLNSIGDTSQMAWAAGKIIDPTQIKQGGATTGQALAWNGTDYAPATVGGMAVIFDVQVGRGNSGDPAAPATSIDSNTILGGNIPSSYKHLRLVFNGRSDSAAVLLRFNNDSASNYETEEALANGSSAAAGLNASSAGIVLPDSPTSGSKPMSCTVEIPDYNGTTFDKTAVVTGGKTATTALYMGAVGTWANTAAVTRLAVVAAGTGFVAGTRLTLYGI